MDKEINNLKNRLLQFEEVTKMTQNLNSELQKKNENLEIENRTLEEELHTLKDNYENLKKRFELLQKEITGSKLQASKKSSMFDWIINNGVKDENMKLQEKIQALETELNLKIQENEEIHIEIFEAKQIFDTRISNLEMEIEKMKLMLNDKTSELNISNEANLNLMKIQRSLENNLNMISENLKKTENELNLKLNNWKIKKINFKKEISDKNLMEKNLLPINEYKNKRLNSYNIEFSDSPNFTSNKLEPSLRFLSSLINNFTLILLPLDNFMDCLIERLNYVYTNIDLKTEHRGYLFACDRMRFHSFILQQIIRTAILFSKIISRNLEEPINFYELELNKNILLTLLNRLFKYIELICKYYKIMMKEERKISYNDSFSGDGKLKVNKDLKYTMTILCRQISIILKKINLIACYDENYNMKNIRIISDNTSGLIIKVSTNYFRDYKINSNLKLSQRCSLINSLFSKDYTNLKTQLKEFLNNYWIKTEIEYKIFETIKEETKSKYNYPIINLSALKMNNENIKKFLNLFNDSVIKLENFINSSISNVGTEVSSLDDQQALLFIKTWELDNDLSFSLFKIIQNIQIYKNFETDMNKEYMRCSSGVDFAEAIQNKSMLKEMLEKETSMARDRENYVNKLNEYEEDLKCYREKLDEEKNLNDLLRTQVYRGNTNTLNLSTCNTSHNDTNSNNEVQNELDDYLKTQLNISEIPFEILSDDVQSGKQRSTFKLSYLDKAIPLTKFTAQIENDQDVSVLYHRKILEKLQRHASKLKSTDLKALSNIHLEEIKSEYENKITEINIQHESKISECVNKYESEMENSRKIIHQKDENITGFQELIEYLNNSLNELKLENNKKNDELKLKEEQLKQMEKNITFGKNSFNDLKDQINEKILIIHQKEEHIKGFEETIQFMNNAVYELQELKDSVRKCTSCVRFVKN